jgi:energy-coupling factor transport system ATP-binding protein
MTVLRIEEFSYRYPRSEAAALRDIDLEVAEGELVLVAGRSASGKSTLLRAACGLVPHFHGGEAAGRVVVAGIDARHHGPADLAGTCGALLQDPETQVVMGSVRAEIAFALENRGWPTTAIAREVEEVALALGIGELLDRPTHELSGGELQRVALGAAIAGRPPLVVLDEPTSQLDPVAGDELVWLIRRLNEQWGTAVLLAEHRLERCLAAADRVIAIEDGRIVADVPPREFLTWAATASPELQTPAAELFASAGLGPPPSGVKDARATLRGQGLLPAAASPAPEQLGAIQSHRLKARGDAALELDRTWMEYRGGRAALRGLSLRVEPGERVAVMGRNGAGKSTLLRIAAGLTEPTRGSRATAGRVALLLQNPGDYLVRDRVGDELDEELLDAAGLGALADRHPRDLSGGERQRLALAIVTAPAEENARPLAAVCLDEPTRGMDHAHRDELIESLRRFATAGVATVVATHDAELAAAYAERVILLGEGEIVADGPTAEILSGGWYFATETARVLGGAGQALLPAQGAELLRRRMSAEVVR